VTIACMTNHNWSDRNEPGTEVKQLISDAVSIVQMDTAKNRTVRNRQRERLNQRKQMKRRRYIIIIIIVWHHITRMQSRDVISRERTTPSLPHRVSVKCKCKCQCYGANGLYNIGHLRLEFIQYTEVCANLPPSLHFRSHWVTSFSIIADEF